MSTWKLVKVGALGKVVTGKTPQTAVIENYGGNIPFLTPSDDMMVKYVNRTAKTLTERGLLEVKNAILPPDSVCVSCIGSDLGKAVITTQATVTNQQINSIIVDREYYDVSYVYYAMLILGKQLNFISKTSTAVPIINKSSFSSYEILCPSLDEQKRIAAILSSLDSKIECNQKINDNLQQQAQAIYKSWFIEFGPFNGAMPSDWVDGTVADLAQDIICGKTPSTRKAEFYGMHTPFITIPDMHGNVYTVVTERYLSSEGVASQPKKTLPANSVCVSCIGTAGLVTLTSEESQTNQQINSILPRDGVSAYYVYLLMQSLSEVINKLGQSGSTIVNLNKAQFGKIQITIPPPYVMQDFDSLCSPLFKQILVNQRENIKLSSLRDALLPKLMSGEIDVSGIQL